MSKRTNEKTMNEEAKGISAVALLHMVVSIEYDFFLSMRAVSSEFPPLLLSRFDTRSVTL